MFKTYQSLFFFPLQLCYFSCSFSKRHKPSQQEHTEITTLHAVHSNTKLEKWIAAEVAEWNKAKIKCNLNSYICQTLHRNPLSQPEDMRDPVRACVYRQQCIHAFSVCAYMASRVRVRGNHISPCGVSVGRHCGASASACGIPSVSPSTSCSSK